MTQPLAYTYVEEFGKVCRERNNKEFALVHGASKENLTLLQEKYPDAPESLVQMLSQVDGTYYRKYENKEVCILLFEYDEIPYYLNSVEQILKQNGTSIAYLYGDPNLEKSKVPEYYADFMHMVGQGIDPLQPFSNMLHISDCSNDGGSSALYIDFHPAPGGIKGQIVRFVHDPDEYSVIAPSFDAFLETCLEQGFEFIKFIEEKLPNPARDAFIARLQANDPAAEKLLEQPAVRAKILSIMQEIPSPAVLRACIKRMEELFSRYDEIAPSGYTYGPQYEYLGRAFQNYSHVYLNNPELRKEVEVFARKVKYLPLYQQLNLEKSKTETAEIFLNNCGWFYVMTKYEALSPEDFFEESVLAWHLPAFEEYFKTYLIHDLLKSYVPGKRERLLKFLPAWKERFFSLKELSNIQIAMLADLAENTEDLERLKKYYKNPAQDLYMLHLARFCHALCLVGEQQIDAYLPWVFEQIRASLKKRKNFFSFRSNNTFLFLENALRNLQEDKKYWSDFTFIVALRPEKSLELLTQINALLKEKSDKEACASLVYLLKEKIKENAK